MSTVKLKFLVVILAHLSSVHNKKLKFLAIILPYESSVHCKIEISSGHFSPSEKCAL